MKINPIAYEVQEVFDGVVAQTTSFAVNKTSAIRGMIVSGDAGVGKTYNVKMALAQIGAAGNVEILKGGKITAASLYVKLYQNRQQHRILVLDDCDIIHHQDRQQIIPMLLGATELGPKGEVTWEVARKNPLMEAANAPTKFDFEGSIIWITNDTIEDIAAKAKQWKSALLSRFNMSKCYFTDEQKFMYTLYLVQQCDMLGKKCQEHKNGYPKAIIDQALDYMSDHYRDLVEITPRQAIKIADIMHYQKDSRLQKTMLKQLWS